MTVKFNLCNHISLNSEGTLRIQQCLTAPNNEGLRLGVERRDIAKEKEGPRTFNFKEDTEGELRMM
jgi:hypothetical protein